MYYFIIIIIIVQMTTFKTFNEQLISHKFSCYPYNIRKIGKH